MILENHVFILKITENLFDVIIRYLLTHNNSILVKLFLVNVLGYLPWQTKRSWKLTVTCYVSRRCQVNGPFSFLFVFPILLCKHLVFCWKLFCYAILFPVATRWEAPSWYHFNCLEDGWDAGSRSEGAVQSASWASNVDCVWVELSASPCMLIKDSPSSIPYRVRIYCFEGKINFCAQ